MTDKMLVLTTTGNEAEAHRIAQELVDRRLAACVNIIPRIHSVYRWGSKVESGEEFLLLIKTRETRRAEVQSVISELHSYQLPECVALSIEAGSQQYLNWIDDSVGDR
jgi:periplasmic divalent cation tolerance protein